MSNKMSSTAGASPLSLVGIDTNITILNIGIKFSYIIPSFSVINVDLLEVRVQFLEKEDSASDSPLVMMDAFIRADPELDKVVPPFTIQLKDYCFVSVSRVLSTFCIL